MKLRKIIAVLITAAVMTVAFTACGGNSADKKAADTAAATVTIADGVYYGTGYHFSLDDTWKVSEIVQEGIECTMQLASPENEMEAATMLAVQPLPDAKGTAKTLGESMAAEYQMVQDITVLSQGECAVGEQAAYSVVIQVLSADGIKVNMNQLVISNGSNACTVMITAGENYYHSAMEKAESLLSTFVVD
ncbi:MAG: hypothetical protein IJ368_06465 [Oscillospiraceae bacterium]|nr:hypothetical protein [Oscillospiraceae bacterium]